MQGLGKNQLQVLCLHLIGLVHADSGFQCQEMFERDPVGFGKNLAPTITACCFYSEHSQPAQVELRVVILGDSRENEVRS